MRESGDDVWLGKKNLRSGDGMGAVTSLDSAWKQLLAPPRNSLGHGRWQVVVASVTTALFSAQWPMERWMCLSHDPVLMPEALNQLDDLLRSEMTVPGPRFYRHVDEMRHRGNNGKYFCACHLDWSELPSTSCDTGADISG